jgi:hypothetical protein
MGSEKKANRQEPPAPKGPRKPYVKPMLRRLGTVRELTHGHTSKGIK